MGQVATRRARKVRYVQYRKGDTKMGKLAGNRAN